MTSNNETMQNDALGALWQQQAPIDVDLKKVERMAKSQQIKQRFYVFLDVLTMFPAWGILFLDLQLSQTIRVFLSLNAVLITVMVLFFIKLRWVSLFHSADSTSDYHTRLLKQLHNNVKIAFYNKHSAWLATIIIALVFTIDVFAEGDSQAVLIKQLYLVAVMGLLFMLPWYIWAHKRQRRFEREAQNIETMLVEGVVN